MNAGKVVGYISCLIGLVILMGAFLAPLNDMFSLATASLLSSSEDPQSLIMSLYVSAMAPWLVLAITLFVVGGIGFYVGRNKKSTKTPSLDEINQRLERLEKTVGENSKEPTKEYDAIEDKQKNTS